MGSESPLHQALAAWRRAEHRLAETAPDDRARPGLVAEVDALRSRYQALFEEVEDVAGHRAPFADDADELEEPPASPEAD
jgi:hypothetical protein